MFSSSWPTCFLTMEAPALHQPHRKHLIFHSPFTLTPITCEIPGPSYLSCQVQHAAVWRLCVEPGQSGRCGHRGQCCSAPASPPFIVDPHIYSLQLLEQSENTVPPPAEKDLISSLPTVCVSQEQTGNWMNIGPG